MPLDVLRYSKEDPSFPNYSTANQFLSEAEFANLAILGRESMIKALRDQCAWLFGPWEEPPEIDLDEGHLSYSVGGPMLSRSETEPALAPAEREDGRDPGAPIAAAPTAPTNEAGSVPIPDGPTRTAENDEPVIAIDYTPGEPAIKVLAPPPSRKAPTGEKIKTLASSLESKGGPQ